jgi:hypothetical protein
VDWINSVGLKWIKGDPIKREKKKKIFFIPSQELETSPCVRASIIDDYMKKI